MSVTNDYIRAKGVTDEMSTILERHKLSQMWRFLPVILASREAEVKRTTV
jgi:hypothetical protein